MQGIEINRHVKYEQGENSSGQDSSFDDLGLVFRQKFLDCKLTLVKVQSIKAFNFHQRQRQGIVQVGRFPRICGMGFNRNIQAIGQICRFHRHVQRVGDIFGEAFGIEVEEIHSMGGAARSDLWLQIKADICDYPIVRMEEEETSTLGAAIIASVQVGDYENVEEAVKVMVKKGKRFEPESANKEVYDRSFELYHELYNNLKETFKKFSN